MAAAPPSFDLHQVLVSDLAELHEIRFEAVHLLVDLPVVGHLLPQVLLQLALTVMDLFHSGLQTLRVALDPERTAQGKNELFLSITSFRVIGLLC